MRLYRCDKCGKTYLVKEALAKVQFKGLYAQGTYWILYEDERGYSNATVEDCEFELCFDCTAKMMQFVISTAHKREERAE
ncbi:MAG: hypothetical protein IIZ93_15440 [Acidaminococcaceae bacterium]|nr:hypothetical protein [Acidaminococcaceae bacterium]